MRDNERCLLEETRIILRASVTLDMKYVFETLHSFDIFISSCHIL